MSQDPILSFSVLVGQSRLDALLADVLPGVSRKIAREACDNNFVRVNGRRAKAGHYIEEKNLVEVYQLSRRSASRRFDPADTPRPDVLYEDEDLLILDKPRCMHSVTLRDDDPLTLADSIATHWPQCRDASPDTREAGLVQRLDFYTTGAIIACKNRAAWEFVRKLLKSEQVQKSYLALVEGRLEGSLECEAPLDDIARRTTVESLKQIRDYATVVRARAKRAARHQVRAHLAQLGHPLVGDEEYGSKQDLARFDRSLGTGFLLHSESVSLLRPGTKAMLSVRSQSNAVENLLQRSNF